MKRAKRAWHFWLHCAVGALCVVGLTRCDGVSEVAPEGQKDSAVPLAGTQQKVSIPWLTQCEPLDSLESGEQPPSSESLAWCSQPAAPSALERQGVVCPPSSGVAVLIDNDNQTARAGTWRNLLQELSRLPPIECADDAPYPLLDLPAGCGTIQTSVLGSCRRGAAFFPAGRAGDGSTTPAPEALRRAGKLLTQAGSPWNLVLFAFDGVVDGDYERHNPPQKFGEAAGEQVAAGLGLHVVADPKGYRYLYVLSHSRYAEFGKELASQLAIQWNAQAFSLSEHGFLEPGRRAQMAAPTLRQVRMPGPHWDNSRPPLFRGPASQSWRIELSDWLTKPSSAGAAFRLTWESRPEAWSKLAPPGVLVAAPELRSNRHLVSRERSNHPWSVEAPAVVQPLEGCPAPKNLGAAGDERNYSTPLAQSLTVAPGRADLLLLRGDRNDLGWVRDWSQPFRDKHDRGAAPTHDPLLFERTESWLRELRASAATPLVSLALVAPSPQKDPCLEELLGRTTSSFQWSTSDRLEEKLGGQLPERCSEAPWWTLVAEFRGTPWREFDWASGSVFRSPDARVSIETFLRVLRETGREALRRRREKGEGEDCVLGTFRVIFQPGFQDAQWQRVLSN
jgi:hypothetical protein